MRAFSDQAGRTWLVKLDGVLLKELKEAHGIDLADIGGASYARLNRDPSALTIAVCFLCREQREKDSLTDKQFAAQLFGESLEAAWIALWEAAKLFFPARLWSALELRYSQQIQMLDGWESMVPMLTLLNRPECPEGMRDAAMSHLAKLMSGMDLSALAANPSATGPVANPSNAATDSPAIAESGQAV